MAVFCGVVRLRWSCYLGLRVVCNCAVCLLSTSCGPGPLRSCWCIPVSWLAEIGCMPRRSLTERNLPPMRLRSSHSRCGCGWTFTFPLRPCSLFCCNDCSAARNMPSPSPCSQHPSVRRSPLLSSSRLMRRSGSSGGW